MDVFDQIVPPITLDETKDYFVELVGEGKKFKDVKDLAKGKAYADAHVTNLEKTLEAMRAELVTRKTAEDLINQITLANQRNDPSNRGNPPVDEQITDPNKSGLSPEDVERMFAEREAKARRDNNLNMTTQKLRDTHGDNAATVLQEKARELGVDTAYLKGLAQDNPTVFLSLFNKPVDRPDRDGLFVAPPQNSYRPPSNAYQGDKWSDFQRIKASDPSLYWSPKYQRKIMDAADKAEASGNYELFKNS